MSTIGTHTHTAMIPPAAGGCGGGAGAAPNARPATNVNFAIPAATGGGTTPPAERFVTSTAGGVIIGADKAPAGRIPAGSFIDTTTGTIYDAEGKAIQLPIGASVDFFDLPDIATLVAAARQPAAGTVSGGGATPPTSSSGGGHASTPPMKTMVDGQWGPGGITPVKAGLSDDCGMDHSAPTKGGGATTPPGKLVGYTPATTGGGLATSVAGVNGIGTPPTLESSLAELIATLRELSLALAKTTGGGAPTQTAPTKPVSGPATPPPIVPTTPSSSSGSGSSSS